MIANLLSLTRPLIFLDTETTGLDVQACRIVELAFVAYYPDGTFKEWRSLIDPGVPIGADVVAIHGITDAHVKGCQSCAKDGIERMLKRPTRADEHPVSNEGFISEDPDGVRGPCVAFKPWPTFKQLAPSLAKGFIDCDFVGQNVRFDLQILANEFARAGVAWSYEGAKIVDTKRVEEVAVPRSLKNLYKKYAGQELVDAHHALHDVKASVAVLAGQLTVHALPRDVAALHDLIWPGWLVADGSFRTIDGVPTCCFGKHRMKPMSAVPADYYDYILRNSFPADVKRLASEAKAGRYP